uniref:Uncharacterized protein n=1 Tax=Anopheles maculatus TaxID=74869 RepID=A0A182SVV1_9DIPT
MKMKISFITITTIIILVEIAVKVVHLMKKTTVAASQLQRFTARCSPEWLAPSRHLDGEPLLLQQNDNVDSDDDNWLTLDYFSFILSLCMMKLRCSGDEKWEDNFYGMQSKCITQHLPPAGGIAFHRSSPFPGQGQGLPPTLKLPLW